MELPLICMQCGTTGTWLGHVASELRCAKCGSNDLDINDLPSAQGASNSGDWGVSQGPYRDEDEEPEDDGEVHLPPDQMRTYNEGYDRGRAGHPQMHGFSPEHQDAHDMGYSHGARDRGYDVRRQGAAKGPGTGWGGSHPDQDANWDEYAGPTPGANPKAQQKNDADATGVCPICHGTKTDPRAGGGGYEETVCRNCHGTGRVTYTTGQPQVQSLDAHKPGPVPLGGGWQGKAATVAKADRIDIQASCPSGDMRYTSLVKDRNGEAWWHCASCGPLANLDANPLINPRDPGKHFVPDRSMKTVGKVFNRRRGNDGKLFNMTAAVVKANRGLSPLQALDISRRTLLTFPEGR